MLIAFGKCRFGLLKNLTNNQKLIIFNYVQCNYNKKSSKKCCDDAEGCAKQAQGSRSVSKGLWAGVAIVLALLQARGRQVSLSLGPKLGGVLDL